MGTPKVNCSDATLRTVKQIKGMQGKKNKIDTYYEYEQLGKLLADVQQGKLDKNLIENDVLYIKGLQLEYQQTYLGEEGRGQSSDTPAPKTTETQKETNGHAEPAKAEAQKEKPAAPVKEKPTESVPANPPKAETPKETPPAEQPKAGIPDKPKPKNPPKADPDKPQESSTTNTNNEHNNANNGSVVVRGDNNNIYLGAAGIAGAVAPGKADKAAGAAGSANDETMINKSKQNYTAAFAEGKQVAKDLIGYTTTEEKQNAIRYIMKQSPDTIMGFINGFNENDSVLGVPYGKGGLLDQVDNEYGWTNSEKNEVFTKVISTTLNWAKAVGFENDPNYKSLESILKQLSTKGQIDTERADLLIKELITKGMAKAGI